MVPRLLDLVGIVNFVMHALLTYIQVACGCASRSHVRQVVQLLLDTADHWLFLRVPYRI
jgi:hypothetical protein